MTTSSLLAVRRFRRGETDFEEPVEAMLEAYEITVRPPHYERSANLRSAGGAGSRALNGPATGLTHQGRRRRQV
jgi:hypothetical protein